MASHRPPMTCSHCRHRKIKCDGKDPYDGCISRDVQCLRAPTKTPQRVRQASQKWPPLASSFEVSALEADQVERSFDRTDPKSLCAKNTTDSNLRSLRIPEMLPRSSEQHRHDAKEVQPSPFTRSMTLSWTDVSVARYLSFIRSDPGELNPWTTFAVTSRTQMDQNCTYFGDALAAVSLQRLSREPGLRYLRWHASAVHTRSLRLFRRSLTNPAQASSDAALVSIRLLIIYCFNSMGPPGPPTKSKPEAPHDDLPPSLEATQSVRSGPAFRTPGPLGHGDPASASVHPHFDGLLQMLLIRGQQQTESYMSCQLFNSIRDVVIVSYAARCKMLPISRARPKWLWFFDAPVTSPADSLTNVAIDVPLLRSRMRMLRRQADDHRRHQDAQALKDDAYELLSRLQVWLSSLPDEWQNPHVVSISPEQSIQDQDSPSHHVAHLYPRPLQAMVIGRLLAYQIMLLQIVSTCVEAEMGRCESGSPSSGLHHDDEWLLDEEYENAAANQRSIVDVICALLSVYSLKEDKVYELGREIPPGGLQHGSHLVVPILIAQSVPSVPAHQKKFLGLKMRELIAPG